MDSVTTRVSIRPYARPPKGSQPLSLYEPYRATIKRAPLKPLIVLPHTLSQITGPIFGHEKVGGKDNDLTSQHAGEPLGERIIVSGRVLDSNGRPVPNALIEIWQANSAGRYRHIKDQHPAPLDPNFSGAGRTLTDEHGAYRFITIKPGAYPWLNHYNAWRPAHIHFSVFACWMVMAPRWTMPCWKFGKPTQMASTTTPRTCSRKRLIRAGSASAASPQEKMVVACWKR